MSCDEFVITAGGRGGIGVIQPQSGLDYPLVAPSADIRYLIADFYLAYDDPGFYSVDIARRKHPLRIKWLYGVGCAPASAPEWAPTPVHAADILIVDEVDNVVFDSTALVPAGGDTGYQGFQKIEWGADLVIYEWIGNNGVCRLVAYKTWPPAFEIAPKNWPEHIAPENAVLDERAVYKLPRRLKSLKVAADNVVLGTARRASATLAAGYNMLLEVATTAGSLQDKHTITFNADSGAGAGRYDDCADVQPPILQINGATPNEYGDFTISGPDCIWVRQPTTISGDRAVPVRAASAATLAIGSNCTPCCDCPDYVETGRYMNRVALRYAAIGEWAHKVKILHEDNINRWLAQRDCRLARPLRVQVVPQNCPFVDIVAMYCNQCQQCATDVELTVSMSAFPALSRAASVVCGYSFLYAPGINGKETRIFGDYPTFTARLPPIDVGNSAYIKFRLQFFAVETEDGQPGIIPAHAVTATITATKDGQPLLEGCDDMAAPVAAAVATSTLNCYATGSTVQACDADS
jgi:hypothetical protein